MRKVNSFLKIFLEILKNITFLCGGCSLYCDVGFSFFLSRGDNSFYIGLVLLLFVLYFFVFMFVVDFYVCETENRIDDKDGKEPIILSNAHDSNQVSICFEDRTPANFSSISADSRLEVLYSTAEDGTIDYSKAIEITILQKKAEGAIQSISTADKTVRIDGTDYEYVSAFKAYSKGKEVTLVANNEELCDKNIDVPNQGEKSKIYFNELNPGDIIQYRTNQNGQVSLLNVLSRFDKDKMYAKYFVSNPSEDYLSYMILECGKVTKYKAGGYFTLENDLSRKYSLSDKRMPIYLYLYNLSTGTVEVLPSMSYLREATEANPDYVFVKTRRTSVRDVVIYRQ